MQETYTSMGALQTGPANTGYENFAASRRQSEPAINGNENSDDDVYKGVLNADITQYYKR